MGPEPIWAPGPMWIIIVHSIGELLLDNYCCALIVGQLLDTISDNYWTIILEANQSEAI